MHNKILREINLIISDVDGVWTDGGMYYSDNGVELKKFSTYDSGAVILLDLAKIPLIILTGENNAILENRFLKLKIKDFRLGIKNKKSELERILNQYNIERKNVAFVGDFINDYLIMKEIGIPVCPRNACKEIKKVSKIIIRKKGGEGVLWDLTKRILEAKKEYRKIFEKYIQSLENV